MKVEDDLVQPDGLGFGLVCEAEQATGVGDNVNLAGEVTAVVNVDAPGVSDVVVVFDAVTDVAACNMVGITDTDVDTGHEIDSQIEIGVCADMDMEMNVNLAVRVNVNVLVNVDGEVKAVVVDESPTKYSSLKRARPVGRHARNNGQGRKKNVVKLHRRGSIKDATGKVVALPSGRKGKVGRQYARQAKITALCAEISAIQTPGKLHSMKRTTTTLVCGLAATNHGSSITASAPSKQGNKSVRKNKNRRITKIIVKASNTAFLTEFLTLSIPSLDDIVNEDSATPVIAVNLGLLNVNGSPTCVSAVMNEEEVSLKAQVNRTTDTGIAIDIAAPAVNSAVVGLKIVPAITASTGFAKPTESIAGVALSTDCQAADGVSTTAKCSPLPNGEVALNGVPSDITSGDTSASAGATTCTATTSIHSIANVINVTSSEATTGATLGAAVTVTCIVVDTTAAAGVAVATLTAGTVGTVADSNIATILTTGSILSEVMTVPPTIVLNASGEATVVGVDCEASTEVVDFVTINTVSQTNSHSILQSIPKDSTSTIILNTSQRRAIHYAKEEAKTKAVLTPSLQNKIKSGSTPDLAKASILVQAKASITQLKSTQETYEIMEIKARMNAVISLQESVPKSSIITVAPGKDDAVNSDLNTTVSCLDIQVVSPVTCQVLTAVICPIVVNDPTSIVAPKLTVSLNQKNMRRRAKLALKLKSNGNDTTVPCPAEQVLDSNSPVKVIKSGCTRSRTKSERLSLLPEIEAGVGIMSVQGVPYACPKNEWQLLGRYPNSNGLTKPHQYPFCKVWTKLLLTRSGTGSLEAKLAYRKILELVSESDRINLINRQRFNMKNLHENHVLLPKFLPGEDDLPSLPVLPDTATIRRLNRLTRLLRVRSRPDKIAFNRASSALALEAGLAREKKLAIDKLNKESEILEGDSLIDPSIVDTTTSDLEGTCVQSDLCTPITDVSDIVTSTILSSTSSSPVITPVTSPLILPVTSPIISPVISDTLSTDATASITPSSIKMSTLPKYVPNSVFIRFSHYGRGKQYNRNHRIINDARRVAAEASFLFWKQEVIRDAEEKQMAELESKRLSDLKPKLFMIINAPEKSQVQDSTTSTTSTFNSTGDCSLTVPVVELEPLCADLDTLTNYDDSSKIAHADDTILKSEESDNNCNVISIEHSGTTGHVIDGTSSSPIAKATGPACVERNTCKFGDNVVTSITCDSSSLINSTDSISMEPTDKNIASESSCTLTSASNLPAAKARANTVEDIIQHGSQKGYFRMQCSPDTLLHEVITAAALGQGWNTANLCNDGPWHMSSHDTSPVPINARQRLPVSALNKTLVELNFENVAIISIVGNGLLGGAKSYKGKSKQSSQSSASASGSGISRQERNDLFQQVQVPTPPVQPAQPFQTPENEPGVGELPEINDLAIFAQGPISNAIYPVPPTFYKATKITDKTDPNISIIPLHSIFVSSHIDDPVQNLKDYARIRINPGVMDPEPVRIDIENINDVPPGGYWNKDNGEMVELIPNVTFKECNPKFDYVAATVDKEFKLEDSAAWDSKYPHRPTNRNTVTALALLDSDGIKKFLGPGAVADGLEFKRLVQGWDNNLPWAQLGAKGNSKGEFAYSVGGVVIQVSRGVASVAAANSESGTDLAIRTRQILDVCMRIAVRSFLVIKSEYELEMLLAESDLMNSLTIAGLYNRFFTSGQINLADPRKDISESLGGFGDVHQDVHDHTHGGTIIINSSQLRSSSYAGGCVHLPTAMYSNVAGLSVLFFLGRQPHKPINPKIHPDFPSLPTEPEELRITFVAYINEHLFSRVDDADQLRAISTDDDATLFKNSERHYKNILVHSGTFFAIPTPPGNMQDAWTGGKLPGDRPLEAAPKPFPKAGSNANHWVKLANAFYDNWTTKAGEASGEMAYYDFIKTEEFYSSFRNSKKLFVKAPSPPLIQNQQQSLNLGIFDPYDLSRFIPMRVKQWYPDTPEGIAKILCIKEHKKLALSLIFSLPTSIFSHTAVKAVPHTTKNLKGVVESHSANLEPINPNAVCAVAKGFEPLAATPAEILAEQKRISQKEEKDKDLAVLHEKAKESADIAKAATLAAAKKADANAAHVAAAKTRAVNLITSQKEADVLAARKKRFTPEVCNAESTANNLANMIRQKAAKAAAEAEAAIASAAKNQAKINAMVAKELKKVAEQANKKAKADEAAAAIAKEQSDKIEAEAAVAAAEVERDRNIDIDVAMNDVKDHTDQFIDFSRGMEVDILPDTDNMSDDSESLPTLNHSKGVPLIEQCLTEASWQGIVLKHKHVVDNMYQQIMSSDKSKLLKSVGTVEKLLDIQKFFGVRKELDKEAGSALWWKYSVSAGQEMDKQISNCLLNQFLLMTQCTMVATAWCDMLATIQVISAQTQATFTSVNGRPQVTSETSHGGSELKDLAALVLQNISSSKDWTVPEAMVKSIRNNKSSSSLPVAYQDPIIIPKNYKNGSPSFILKEIMLQIVVKPWFLIVDTVGNQLVAHSRGGTKAQWSTWEMLQSINIRGSIAKTFSDAAGDIHVFSMIEILPVIHTPQLFVLQRKTLIGPTSKRIIEDQIKLVITNSQVNKHLQGSREAMSACAILINPPSRVGGTKRARGPKDANASGTGVSPDTSCSERRHFSSRHQQHPMETFLIYLNENINIITHQKTPINKLLNQHLRNDPDSYFGLRAFSPSVAFLHKRFTPQQASSPEAFALICALRTCSFGNTKNSWKEAANMRDHFNDLLPLYPTPKSWKTTVIEARRRKICINTSTIYGAATTMPVSNGAVSFTLALEWWNKIIVPLLEDQEDGVGFISSSRFVKAYKGSPLPGKDGSLMPHLIAADIGELGGCVRTPTAFERGATLDYGGRRGLLAFDSDCPTGLALLEKNRVFTAEEIEVQQEFFQKVCGFLKATLGEEIIKKLKLTPATIEHFSCKLDKSSKRGTAATTKKSSTYPLVHVALLDNNVSVISEHDLALFRNFDYNSPTDTLFDLQGQKGTLAKAVISMKEETKLSNDIDFKKCVNHESWATVNSIQEDFTSIHSSKGSCTKLVLMPNFKSYWRVAVDEDSIGSVKRDGKYKANINPKKNKQKSDDNQSGQPTRKRKKGNNVMQ